MAKRELIDRNNLESTTITTDDYSGNEVLDVVLMEDVEEAPVINEQEIVKPYLDKIRERVEKLQKACGKDDLNWSAQYSAFGMVLDIIDEYKAESEGE